MNERGERKELLGLFLKCRYADYHHAAGDVSYAYTLRNGELTVLFEQSAGRVDWRNNLQFLPVPYRKGGDVWLCHRGFLRAWRIARADLMDVIQNPGVHRVSIVGYSHGGALAMLCHEYVWFHRPDLRDRITGYGFGAPRVYWGFWIPTALRERWRTFTVVRNRGDIVTHLPPKIVGYRHVGRLWEIGQRGAYGGIAAHRPETYRRELQREEQPDFSHGFRQ